MDWRWDVIPSSIWDYLDQHRASYAIIPHPVAYTTQEEAAASHVSGRRWAKSVVCFADGQPILVVLPAPSSVDLRRLREAVHADSVRIAQESEFANLYQGCEVGAMPPFGPLYGQRVYIDKGLTANPEIAFDAGSHREAIRMSYWEFERLTKPTVADFAIPPASRSETGTGSR
jgi:Ala-tRNA(Pro) deacylase